MEVLKTIGKIDPDGHLRLDLLTNLPEGEFDLLLVIGSVSEDTKEAKYDFSDLVGKLSWKGNAVVVQRELRNEW